jgi:molecular chaperone HtpG
MVESAAMERAFQVDLHGLVDLLSHHLYSSPKVFARELLQNAVDAITARRALEPGHGGTIAIEVVPPSGKDPATLIVTDDGIGLSLADAELFLATIGRSSKRTDLGELRKEFLGQFGIGLLACFVISDEIVVVSQSATSEAPVEWRGRPDGTYTVRELPVGIGVGTRVYLRARADAAEWFEPETVRELVSDFGEFLPYRITFRVGSLEVPITGEPLPWERSYPAPEMRDRDLLQIGSERLQTGMMDVIDIDAPSGGVRGLAYFVGSSMSPVAKPAHRVYLKRMLVSSRLEELLPDWAFFVKCIVNTEGLRPTASREQIFDDEAFRSTRDELGRGIRDALVRLAADDPERLRRIVDTHYIGLKALAVHDGEFLRLFADWLPMETSLGRMTIGQLRAHNPRVRYARSHDDFHQLAQVAAARGDAIVNGGLVFDQDLVGRLPEVFPDVTAEPVNATDFIAVFESLDLEERMATTEFLRIADAVLQPLDCEAEIRRFEPSALPGLLSTPASALYRREIEQSKAGSTDLWASILDGLAASVPVDRAQLCFNYANPLIQRLVRGGSREVTAAAIGVLYVQAMLLGRHPVSERELSLMGASVGQLLEWATVPGATHGG